MGGVKKRRNERDKEWGEEGKGGMVKHRKVKEGCCVGEGREFVGEGDGEREERGNLDHELNKRHVVTLAAADIMNDRTRTLTHTRPLRRFDPASEREKERKGQNTEKERRSQREKKGKQNKREI